MDDWFPVLFFGLLIFCVGSAVWYLLLEGMREAAILKRQRAEIQANIEIEKVLEKAGIITVPKGQLEEIARQFDYMNALPGQREKGDDG